MIKLQVLMINLALSLECHLPTRAGGLCANCDSYVYLAYQSQVHERAHNCSECPVTEYAIG